ncbi:MAG: AAA family ATPase [Anaerolineae bacterium]|nr:AAA family ATPase [Anaerolineae bacterium]
MVGTSSFETHSAQAESPASSPARLTLSLLGPPQVMVNGRAVIGVETPKVLALLAYLAVEAHRPQPRSALVALFWPDQPEKRALQNLRQALSRLRRAIGDKEAYPSHLLTDPQTIQFNRRSDHWLDVEVFKALLANTQRHRHRRLDACLTCVSQLAQAVEYYRGDFLAGLHPAGSPAFSEWLLIQRERLGQQACTALHALAGSHLARGEPEAARQYARRLLHLDPWNEAAQRLLLCALTLSDGRNAALQHYQEFRQALADELGIEPEDETLALVEQIQAGTLADMQPRAPAALLPTPATPFVGREAERKQIADYLASQDQRLLTLYGPGGSGKTRLALEIAAGQAPLWHDGVWFVPLAGVPAPEQLVDALATTLDLRADDGPLEAAQLIDFLRPKELLLVLDSFEHLATASCGPPLRILTTCSRRQNRHYSASYPSSGADSRLKLPDRLPGPARLVWLPCWTSPCSKPRLPGDWTCTSL